MKSILWMLLFAFFNEAFGYYEESQHITLLNPLALSQLHEEPGDELWMVQFFDGQDAGMTNLSIEYERAAKSMEGYVKVAAIEIDADHLLNPIMEIDSLPAHFLYSFYKYLPIPADVTTTDDMHSKCSRELDSIFEERSIPRFVDTHRNFELGMTDIDHYLLDSLEPWALVFYDPASPKCLTFASDVWFKLVGELKEKIYFGSVNNPYYKVMKKKVIDYPVIKYYPAGKKNLTKYESFTDELTYESVHQFLFNKIENPKITHILNQTDIMPFLKSKFCIFAFLPKANKDNILSGLETIAETYKLRSLIWFWNEFNEQADLQQLFSIDKEASNGFLVLVNIKAVLFRKIELPGKDFAPLVIDLLETIENIDEFDSFDGNYKEIEIIDLTAESPRNEKFEKIEL